MTLKTGFLLFFVFEWHQWDKSDVVLFSAFTSAYEPLIVLRILRDLGECNLLLFQLPIIN